MIYHNSIPIYNLQLVKAYIMDGNLKFWGTKEDHEWILEVWEEMSHKIYNEIGLASLMP